LVPCVPQMISFVSVRAPRNPKTCICAAHRRLHRTPTTLGRLAMPNSRRCCNGLMDSGTSAATLRRSCSLFREGAQAR
jgi:hypothetical protein